MQTKTIIILIAAVFVCFIAPTAQASYEKIRSATVNGISLNTSLKELFKKYPNCSPKYSVCRIFSKYDSSDEGFNEYMVVSFILPNFICNILVASNFRGNRYFEKTTCKKFLNLKSNEGFIYKIEYNIKYETIGKTISELLEIIKSKFSNCYVATYKRSGGGGRFNEKNISVACGDVVKASDMVYSNDRASREEWKTKYNRRPPYNMKIGTVCNSNPARYWKLKYVGVKVSATLSLESGGGLQIEVCDDRYWFRSKALRNEYDKRMRMKAEAKAEARERIEMKEKKQKDDDMRRRGSDF